jgi:ferredoxin-NADP reductase
MTIEELVPRMASDTTWLEVEVQGIREEAAEILSFELTAVRGGRLPAFEPAAMWM